MATIDPPPLTMETAMGKPALPPALPPPAPPLTNDSAETKPEKREEIPKQFLSPSKRRAKAAGSAGLSELSKQLRILQAQNEAQGVDINRLERQLRILAELQGISVGDLRKALENACADEAFGELQHRVAKLRHQLEAATLAKKAELSKDASAPHIANLELRLGELEEVEEKQQTEIHHLYEMLRHEKARATRLETESEQHKKDAKEYLERLNKEIAKNQKLEAQYQEQVQKLHDDYAKKLQAQAQQLMELERLQREQQKRLANEAVAGRKDGRDADASAGSRSKPNGEDATSRGLGTDAGQGADAARSLSSAGANGGSTGLMGAEYERLQSLLKDKEEALRKAKSELQAEREKWLQSMRDKDNQGRDAQMSMKMEQDKMALTVQQLKDADSQNDLRLAQYKARFAMQDERITDMEQQLRSLYTAFGLLQEDQNAEDRTKAALKSNLDNANAEYARQLENMDKLKSERKSGRDRGNDPASFPTRGADSGAGSPNYSTPYVQSPANNFSPIRSNFSPIRDGQSEMFPTSATPLSSSRALTSPSAETTPTTWQLLFPEERRALTEGNNDGGVVPAAVGATIAGDLLVKSKSVIRKWKERHARLYVSGSHYTLDIEGKMYVIGFGVSKVEFNPNHPLSFVVYTNPFDIMAPVVHAAAITEEDYHRWMAALTRATTGDEYTASVLEYPARRDDEVPQSPGMMSPGGGDDNYSVHTPLSPAQEDSDLQRALEMSRQQT